MTSQECCLSSTSSPSWEWQGCLWSCSYCPFLNLISLLFSSLGYLKGVIWLYSCNHVWTLDCINVFCAFGFRFSHSKGDRDRNQIFFLSALTPLRVNGLLMLLEFFLDYDWTEDSFQKKSQICKHFRKKMAIGIRSLMINNKESIFLHNFFKFLIYI